MRGAMVWCNHVDPERCPLFEETFHEPTDHGWRHFIPYPEKKLSPVITVKWRTHLCVLVCTCGFNLTLPNPSTMTLAHNVLGHHRVHEILERRHA